MLLQIVHYNEPILRKKGEKIAAFDTELAQLTEDMVETMHVAGGIGLAALQVGRAIQLCVVDLRQAQVDYTWQLDGKKPPKDWPKMLTPNSCSLRPLRTSIVLVTFILGMPAMV